ncbi:hypothetical protein [Nocardia jinanensis]|uniref:Mce-associated membrane protein n=2 Tax=Nocardia jinanensis TaxID=382504 RepID=A0A917RQI4_9NOCA|nr:hypothetical protein [Nocardia jinanensis]GGL17981.1 hypothetical protein GCM10011588_35890 [Nocardia jinanensis]
MIQATTDPLILAAEEADAEAAAAEAEAVAARASATAARARARAARLRREAGTSGEPPGSGATAAEKPDAAAPAAETSSKIADDTAPAAEPDENSEPPKAAETDSERAGTGTDSERAGSDTAATDSADAGVGPGISPEKPGDPKQVRFLRMVRRLPPRAVRRPRGRSLGRVAAAVVVVAAMAVSGFSIWNHHQIGVQQARSDEYLGAARQGVLALTSMDSGRAADDVQRVLDRSTGAFRTDFQTRAEDFTKVVEQSQVATQGEITASAVESMTDESAVVLVSAVSRITNSAGAQQEPRVWRLSVTVTRDGPDLKMSKVEFVP